MFSRRPKFHRIYRSFQSWKCKKKHVEKTSLKTRWKYIIELNNNNHNTFINNSCWTLKTHEIFFVTNFFVKTSWLNSLSNEWSRNFVHNFTSIRSLWAVISCWKLSLIEITSHKIFLAVEFLILNLWNSLGFRELTRS